MLTLTPRFPVGSEGRLAFSITDYGQNIPAGGNLPWNETWYASNDGETSAPFALIAGSYTLRVQDLLYGLGADREVVFEVVVSAVNSLSGEDPGNDTVSTGVDLVYGIEYNDSVGFSGVYEPYGTYSAAYSDGADYYLFTPTEDGTLTTTLLVNDFYAGNPYQNGYLSFWLYDTPNGYQSRDMAGGLIEANGTYSSGPVPVTAGTNYYLSVSNQYGAWAAYSLDTDFTAASADDGTTGCAADDLGACQSEAECNAAGGYWEVYGCSVTPPVDDDVGGGCAADDLAACAGDTECAAVGGYWYADACNATPQDDIDTGTGCAADDLGACLSEAECDSAGGYWDVSGCSVTPPSSDGDGSDDTGSSATLFSEDFESYSTPQLITERNGWSGDDGYVNNATYLSSRVFDGRYDIGSDTYSVIYNSLPRNLSTEERVVLSFDAYATTDFPFSHNTAIGLGVAGDAGKVFWYPAEDIPGAGKWRFDARGVTGVTGDYVEYAGGYDTAVTLKVVVDGINGEVYGLYDFGMGEQETTHYAVDGAAIEALNAVYLYADYRSPTAASTSYGTRFSSIELDNLLVTTSAADATGLDTPYRLSVIAEENYSVGEPLTIGVFVEPLSIDPPLGDLYMAVALPSELGGGLFFLLDTPPSGTVTADFAPLQEGYRTTSSDRVHGLTLDSLPCGLGGDFTLYAAMLEAGRGYAPDNLLSDLAQREISIDECQ